MIGYAFMGAAHSNAWATAPRAFDLPLVPDMAVLVGRDRAAASAAAERLGWREVETDWRAVLDRSDVDVVDICTPGDSHMEIAIAALAAGKHVMCEKPLANTLEQALAMTDAAEQARGVGVRAMVGFNYRRVPALALAREWIGEGRLGTVYQVRAAYRQDWAADPESPLVWRLQRERAGSGALGDIGSHIVDLAQYLLADTLRGVTAVEETFVRERPLSQADGCGPVDVDDCAMFIGRFGGGAMASFEATRFAVGRKNALQIEVNGSNGSVGFDLEALNELQYYDGREDPSTAGFRRVLVTDPKHPYMSAWWPAGHIIGWEHTFTNQVADFVSAIAAGDNPRPSFEDGLQVQRVLAAVSESALNDSRWTTVGARAGASVEAA
jgi:predicted dehydrogenase